MFDAVRAVGAGANRIGRRAGRPDASQATAGIVPNGGGPSRSRSLNNTGTDSPGGISRSPLALLRVTLTWLPGLAPYWPVKTRHALHAS